MACLIIQRLILLQVVFFLTTKRISAIHEQWHGNDYEVLEGEACLRKCMEPRESKICEFNFNVGWWHTMTRDCLDCPQKVEDCYNKNCVTGDGKSRMIQLVNKQLPGPSIQVCEGDLIRVTVENRLLQAAGLSIHWHGIEQRGTPFSDGVPYVTQYYIDSGKSFVYEFLAEPAGTHYWHSHSGMEMGDGLSGPLIVRRPIELEENAHLYDEDLPDHHIYFQIFRDNIEIIAFVEFITNFDESFSDPVSILVNGRSQRVASADGHLTPLTTYAVTQGQRYRFRLIYAGPSGCQPIFYIDQHQLSVIATEVGSIEPIVVDAIAMTPGQRLSIVVHANEPIGKYYITLDATQACGGSGGIEKLTRAILKYEGADQESQPFEPTDLVRLAKESEAEEMVLLNSFSDLRTQGFNDISVSKLKSIINSEENIRGLPDKTIYLKQRTFLLEDAESEIFLGSFEGNPARALFNHIAFKQPPILLRSMNSDEMQEYTCNHESLAQAGVNCSLVYCECTHVYRITLGSLVEIHLMSTYDDKLLHPMHMHGNSFYVVGEGVFEKDLSVEEYKAMDEEGLVSRNFVNAPKIDTITPHRDGYSILRFRADNPGWWFFHCHLEFHIEWGMSVVLVVEDE